MPEDNTAIGTLLEGAVSDSEPQELLKNLSQEIHEHALEIFSNVVNEPHYSCPNVQSDAGELTKDTVWQNILDQLDSAIPKTGLSEKQRAATMALSLVYLSAVSEDTPGSVQTNVYNPMHRRQALSAFYRGLALGADPGAMLSSKIKKIEEFGRGDFERIDQQSGSNDYRISPYESRQIAYWIGIACGDFVTGGPVASASIIKGIASKIEGDTSPLETLSGVMKEFCRQTLTMPPDQFNSLTSIGGNRHFYADFEDAYTRQPPKRPRSALGILRNIDFNKSTTEG